MLYLSPSDGESCVAVRKYSILQFIVKAVCISILQEEYAKLVSQFKLETSIKDEVAEFSGGLNEVSYSGQPTN